jgi:hypothetical protein
LEKVMSSFKESVKQAIDEGVLDEILNDTYKELVEWISESGYKYDGFKYWIRTYQTPITYHHTWEEDWVNTEQLIQKWRDQRSNSGRG